MKALTKICVRWCWQLACTVVLLWSSNHITLTAQNTCLDQDCPFPTQDAPASVAYDDFDLSEYILTDPASMPDGRVDEFYCYNFSIGVPAEVTGVPPSVTGAPLPIDITVTVVSVRFNRSNFVVPPGMQTFCIGELDLGDQSCPPVPGGEKGCFRIGGEPSEAVTDFVVRGEVTVIAEAFGEQASFTQAFALDTINIMEPILPIELTAFSAKAEREATVLEWSTASEIGAEGFEIQKSEDGELFHSISFVSVSGNTYGDDYQHKDYDYTFGKSYYRLKLMDQDGSHTFSEVVGVDRAHSSEISIFPNPAIDHLNVYLGDQTSLNLSIVNELGQVLLQQELQGDRRLQTVPVDQLSAGIYLAVLRTATESRTERIVIR